ncbi:uncharacterized protein [Drosophila suzukii]|uniref:Uncharacterized protein LOC108043643 n=4 Tax=melanogaster group TaxID=32346 RepID=A0A6P4ES88_DRORH|nr:uncharacterized protein LOC26535952 [Drosophila yakuba]XP_016951044.1 uncharacterized protein LOC108025211 [Drosophila biarmipes]XP_017000549.1 uncharacterized protein LOC108059676 [Drosophila takahashii]XP_017131228.1 uncharacterized protein LOC108148630 [Drosophila elegans]XP_026831863.1 uncharacterized protein LOC26526643 [Drosophila erecta]XP_032576312.1 uncharacterized protein LOC116801387 [Drosophila sechellia]XP_033167489.1 uncharacterized protein LOC117145800 [Drosophila mauritiana
MLRDIFLYLVLIVLFCFIFMAQLIVNVYAFQRQPSPHKAERNEIIFV